MPGRQDERLHPFRLVVDDVGNCLHCAPGLPQDMDLVQFEVFPYGNEFVYPGLLGPHLRMPVKVGVAAPYLVVGNHLASRSRHPVQDLKIVMGAARPPVKKEQRRLFGRLSNYTVVCPVAHKGHISFDYGVLSHCGKVVISSVLSGPRTSRKSPGGT